MSAISLRHLRSMYGPLGLYQHATYSKPNLNEGYCTDDNCRSLQFLVELTNSASNTIDDHKRQELAEKSWRFVCAAQNETGRFRNFRGINGEWLDERGTQDTQARVARSLAAVITKVKERGWITEARERLNRLLPHLYKLHHSRSQAEAIIGLAEIALVDTSLEARWNLKGLWDIYYERWRGVVESEWPWLEPFKTYASALLPHALIIGSKVLGIDDTEMKVTRERSSQFLINTTINDYFNPIGNDGWYFMGQSPAEYDQQPIEAHTMLDFLLLFYEIKGEAMIEKTVLPYLWFHGHNRGRVSLVNKETGACYDGLEKYGPNLNQGAESTLAYLRSELLIRQAPDNVRNYAREFLKHQLRQKEGAVHPT